VKKSPTLIHPPSKCGRCVQQDLGTLHYFLGLQVLPLCDVFFILFLNLNM
jgi:hypothetical protein